MDISKGQVVATTVKEIVTPVVVEKGPEYAELMDFVKSLEGAKWIWHPKNPMARGHVKFRATLDLAKSEEAQVVFACDTTATIYVNGEKVAHQPPGAEGFYYGWSVPVRTNLTFKAGRNEITVEAENRYPTDSAAKASFPLHGKVWRQSCSFDGRGHVQGYGTSADTP